MMEEGDVATQLADDYSSKHAEENANWNNVISDQDVNISFGIEECEGPVEDILDQSPQKDEESPPENEHCKTQEESKTQLNLGVPERTSEEQEEKKRMQREKEEWLQKVEEERSEWDALETVQRTSTGGIKSTPAICFAEALEHFQNKTFGTTNVMPTIRRSGFAALIHFFFGPPKLHQSLVEERDLIFSIAKVQLEDSEEMHGRVLQTIYKQLTGSKFDCPRRGSHWETIGFQGSDPATDLRGVGFLGLMQILYAVTDPDVSSLFTDFYRLSLDEEQNYPFCVMSFNVTRIAMQVLREEKLHRECNKRKQVLAVLNDFYVAVFLHIYKIWKSQFKTMKDSGHVMRDAEKQARKNPKSLLSNFFASLKERKGDKTKLLTVPKPSAGSMTAARASDRHGRLSTSSSVNSVSRKENPSDTPPVTTSHSAQTRDKGFVQTRNSTTDNHQDFTDIGTRMKEEPVTDL